MMSILFLCLSYFRSFLPFPCSPLHFSWYTRVNCSFYFKIGACRHGDRCSRKHVKPNFSQTILVPNVYHNPSHDAGCNLTKAEIQEDFDNIYEDFFVELAKYGEIEEMHVCDNIGDHLVGNIYARFKYEEDAGNAVESLNNRFYAGRPLWAELSPVTDFREGKGEISWIFNQMKIVA